MSPRSGSPGSPAGPLCRVAEPAHGARGDGRPSWGRAEALLRRVGPLALVAASVMSACELQEVSLTEPESILVAEIYLRVGEGPDELTAFLQWTLGERDNTLLANASIQLQGEGGVVHGFGRSVRADCLVTEILDDVKGVCFTAEGLVEGSVHPGDHLDVSITLPDGRSLAGGVTLPGDFDFLQPAMDGTCALSPGELLELIWSPSEGAWAYAGETLIWGLRDALRPQGVEVEEDSLTLQGFSITEADTTLVFPKEFGVFDRFDLDRELALALQEGLPPGAEAEVVVAALERNYVNWVRGGNFNPSGAVRVPSLRGDGTGVLGAVVRRTVRVVGGLPDAGTPSCVSESGEPSLAPAIGAPLFNHSRHSRDRLVPGKGHPHHPTFFRQ